MLKFLGGGEEGGAAAWAERNEKGKRKRVKLEAELISK